MSEGGGGKNPHTHAAADRPGFGLIRETLAQSSYWPYVLGNGVSLIGNWLQRTAIGWHVYTMTESAAWVGAAAFADLAPTLLVGPFGGVLADRVDRKRIMITSQIGLSVMAFIIWGAAALDMLDLPLLLVLITINGLLTGVNQPARLALIPALVPPRLMPTAVAINSITFNLARFIGPAAAGVIIALLGLAPAFLLNALSYVAFIGALLLVHPLERQTIRRGGSFGHDMIQGLLYVRHHAALGPLFIMFIAGSLTLRSLGELLPALAGEVFGGGVQTLALLSSTLGLGAIVGGVWLARQPAANQLNISLFSHLSAAIVASAFLLAPSLSLALPLMAIFGVTVLLSGVAAQTLIQLSAEPELRGRVMSMFGLAFRATPAVGALLLGLLGDLIGLRYAQLLGIAVMLVVWLQLWRRRDQLAAGLRPGG